MRPEACPNHVLLHNPIQWGEPSERARYLLDQFPDMTFSHLLWERYAWPGGYEIYYIVHDGGVLCHNCANDELMRTIDPDYHDWYIVDSDVLWEGPPIYCDHCNREIQSAYGETDEETDEELLARHAIERNAAGYWLVPVWDGDSCHHMQVDDMRKAADLLRDKDAEDNEA